MRNFFQWPEKELIDQQAKADATRLYLLIGFEIVLIIGVVYIQEFLRPRLAHRTELQDFLLGTLPSCFAGAAFTALFFVVHKLANSHKQYYNLLRSIFLAAFVAFAGLSLWELMRIVIRPFDVYDVVMCFIGCTISVILILLLYNRELVRLVR